MTRGLDPRYVLLDETREWRPDAGRIWVAPVGTPPTVTLPTYRIPPGEARVNDVWVDITPSLTSWDNIGHIVDSRAERAIRREVCSDRGPRSFAEQAELYLKFTADLAARQHDEALLHRVREIDRRAKLRAAYFGGTSADYLDHVDELNRTMRELAEKTSTPYRYLLGADLAASSLHTNRKALDMGNLSCSSLSCLYTSTCRCRPVECSFGAAGIVTGARVRVEHRTAADEFAEFVVDGIARGSRGGIVAVTSKAGRKFKATAYSLKVLHAPLPTAEGLYVVKGITNPVGVNVYALTGGSWRKWQTDRTVVSHIGAKAVALEAGVAGLVPLTAPGPVRPTVNVSMFRGTGA